MKRPKQSIPNSQRVVTEKSTLNVQAVINYSASLS